MPTAANHTDSVELFVRSLSPTGTTASQHVNEARDLASTDRIDAATITIWGDAVGLSTTARRTDAGELILDRVAAFRRWADERGVTMDPFFEERTVTSAVTGETYTALRLPVSCLAEYVDGELVHVTPYSNGDAVCSVADRLRKLAHSGPDAGPDGAGRSADDEQSQTPERLASN